MLAMSEALSIAGEQLVEKARNEHQWKHRTGNLGRSLKWEKTGSYSGAATQVAGKATYGRYLYYGTRKHTIVPRTAKSLSWIDVGGVRRYAKKVTIPAREGEPWIEDIWKRSGQAMTNAAVSQALVNKGLT